MTTPVERLAPCPFCGGEHLSTEGRSPSMTGVVFCHSCGADGPHPSYERAGWNTRAAHPILALEAEVIEALREAGDVIQCYKLNTGVDLGDTGTMPFYKNTISRVDAILSKLKGDGDDQP